MGLIARARQGQDDEVRETLAEFLADDYGTAGGRTSSGIVVNRRAALSLTTIWRCIDLLSSSVAQAPKDIYLKVGGSSFAEYGRPDWMVTPNPSNPAYTFNDHISEVAISILIEGNFFVDVAPSVLDPQVLTVLDPARVNVKPGPVFEILDANGQVQSRRSPMQVLHEAWMRLPGQLRGISPLEVLRRSIGSAIAAEDHAARFFGQGAALSFGVEVPGKLDEPKKTEFRNSLKAKYAGNENSHAIGVLTDGAKFVPGLAPTPEQAQMLATRQFSVEDLCRPYGVPPQMAGSQVPGAASYASAEVWREEFRDYGVLPLAVHIEQQYARLLQVPAGVTDPSASMQFKFNLDAIARTNLLTRYQAYQAGVMGGFLKPNEARAKEDMAGATGGDQLFMQQQMVPIGDLGATKATEPLVTQPKPAVPAAA
ncbi:MAG TPA: phage portal protein [Candidatus Limnocylindrales bacterium]